MRYLLFCRTISINLLLFAWKYAKTTALFHPRQVFLSFSNVGVNLVISLLDPVQLFCLHRKIFLISIFTNKLVETTGLFSKTVISFYFKGWFLNSFVFAKSHFPQSRQFCLILINEINKRERSFFTFSSSEIVNNQIFNLN